MLKKLIKSLVHKASEDNLSMFKNLEMIIIDEISKQNVYQTPTRRWLKAGDHVIFFKKDGSVPREIKLNVQKGEHLYIYAGLKATR